MEAQASPLSEGRVILQSVVEAVRLPRSQLRGLIHATTPGKTRASPGFLTSDDQIYDPLTVQSDRQKGRDEYFRSKTTET